jgi:hypothetical protein
MTVLEDDYELRLRIDRILRETQRAIKASVKAVAVTNRANDQLRQRLATERAANRTPTSLGFGL